MGCAVLSSPSNIEKASKECSKTFELTKKKVCFVPALAASQNQMRRVTNELSRFSKMLAKAP